VSCNPWPVTLLSKNPVSVGYKGEIRDDESCPVTESNEPGKEPLVCTVDMNRRTASDNVIHKTNAFNKLYFIILKIILN